MPNLDYYAEIGRSIETGEAPATDWTQESARKAGLPEDFWRYALGRETGGTPNPFKATSPVGASGMAQLMPSTALDIQKRHGIDTTTPYGNVLGGATYMKEMLDKAGTYTQDPELQHRLALAQYNAGPTRVAQAINDLRGEGQPITWETISSRLPGETQSYAGRYTYNPPIMQSAVTPQLPPPPRLAETGGKVPGLLRSVGETVEKAYELPGIKQFGEVMGAQKEAAEKYLYKPLLGYQEQTLGERVGKPIKEAITTAGLPAPVAGLGQAGAQFFTDMYTDPLYWELTGAGAALGAAFGGVGAVPGGAMGFLAAAGGRLLQNAPRLARGLTTGLKVAQAGFRTQMGLQAASQAPRGLADIIENPWGAEGWKNLGEAGLAGWYTAHDFLRKPASQTGRVKVSEMVGGNLVEMDPARARDILSTGSMGDVVDLIDAGVQEKWTALADAGWVPRMELPEFHAMFDPEGTDRARAISEPRTNEHTGRIGVDLGHLAADVQSLPPEQRVKGFVQIVNEVVNHEVSHLLNVAGLPHDPRLPANFRREMGELQRLADVGGEGSIPFDQYVTQRDAILQKYGITPDLLYGDPYSIAREISDTESPQNAVGRHLARIVGADPDQFVKEFKADPQGVLGRYDFTPVSRIVDGLQAGLQKIQQRTLGTLQPTIQGPRTPEEVIARMGGVQLRGLGVEPGEFAPPPAMAIRPKMWAEGEKPPDEAGRRGFRFGPTTRGGAEALRGAAVHPRFAAWTREGRVAATPETPLKTRPTPTTGKPTEEMFEPEPKPVRAAQMPEPGEVLDRAAEIKRVPKVEKGRGARTLNVEDLLKGKMRAEGESDFASLGKDQQEQVVEELHNRKEISDQEYYSALDRIDRGWGKPAKGGIPKEEPTPMPPARRLTARELAEETAGRLPKPPALAEPSPVEKEAQRRAQLESKTGQAVSKMQAFGMWGRLSPEQRKVKREAAEVTARSLKRTPEELERERMRTREAQERRIPTEDAFRIVLERVGGRRIDLTDADRETIRYELGVTPTEAKVYQVTNKWAKEPEAPARRAPVRGVREMGPRAQAREIMKQVVAEYNAKREEREQARRGELAPPPAAKPEEMTDEQARARLKEVEAKLRMRAEGEKEDYLKKVEEIGTAPRGERFRASVNIPLTPSGKRDAEIQGRRLAKLGSFDEIYHDNQIRTRDTAEAFKKAMPNAKVLDLGDKTQSQALGGLEGQPVNARTLAETQRLVENPDERPAGKHPESTREGETFNEFLKRYLPVIDQLHEKAQREGLKIALVTHNRNIQTENARLAKQGEEGRGRSIDPEVMREKGPEVGTVNKVIDHATEDWTGKPLEPGLYLVRHAQTAWNPVPTPGLKPPPRLAVTPEEAEKIGVTSKRASVGTKTRSVADILGPEKMKAEAEKEEPEPVPEWLRSAALRSQRMALRKSLKGGEFETATWEATKKAFYEGRLPGSASDPMNRLIGIGAQPAEVEKLPGFTGKDWDKAWEIFGAPRALITSLDLSGTLRQGAIGTAALLIRHPYRLGEALGKSIETLGSETVFRNAMKKIESSDDFHALKAMGVDFAKSEEQFTGGHIVSALLKKLHVPDFVRGSDRAYSYYLNRLRYELGKDHLNKLRRMGFEDAPIYEEMESGAIRARLTGKDAEFFKKIGQWVNIETGRGGLPQGSSKFARTIRSADGFLNSMLFSPRLMYARMALFNPMTYLRTYLSARETGASRLLATRAAFSMHVLDMSAYFGMMMAMGAGLSLLNPDSKFEGDMLSSDFGQIRIGNTRIDVTGGTRTYITALARLILRQTKTEYGNIKYQSAYDTLTNFLRGKLSPTASLGVNLAAGENLIGKPMYATLRDVFTGKTPLDKDSAQKILEETGGQVSLQTALPMILADCYSLVQEHGWTAPETLPLMGGLVLGVGVSTREPIEGATKELQNVMRQVLVSPLQRQGKLATGVKNLLGESIQIDLSERQKDAIEKLVNVPTYQLLSRLIEQPNFKTLPPEAQRVVLVSILAQAKKRQTSVGRAQAGPEALAEGIREGLVPEEFERLSPPPGFARQRRLRPTDIRSWREYLESEPEEES